MKAYFTLLLIVFCAIPGVVKAQSLSGMGLSFAFPETYEGIVVSPNIQFDKKNRTGSFGPILLISYGDQIEQRENVKFTGFYFSSISYPQGREQNVAMFYGLDLWLQRVKDEQDSRYFNTASSTFESITTEQRDNIIQTFLNLGLRIKVSEKLAVSQAIGTGLSVTYRATTSPFDDFKDSFFNQDWMLKTGIILRLN